MPLISLALAKAHLRLPDPDDTSEDLVLQLACDSAAEHVATYIGKPIPDPAPATLVSAGLLILTDLYENRGANMEMKGSQLVENPAFVSLAFPHRVNLGV